MSSLGDSIVWSGASCREVVVHAQERHDEIELRRTLLCTVGSLGLAVTLLGCETQNISATTTLPPLIPAIVWIVALDITTVPKEHFPIFRDEMLPALVLGRTQRGDEIHTMPVDSDPEQHVRVTRLIRNVGFEQEIAALFGTLQSELVRPERYQGTTNLGGVVSYGKPTASWFQEDRARPRPSGSPPPPTPAFVLMILTDGHPMRAGAQPGAPAVDRTQKSTGTDVAVLNPAVVRVHGLQHLPQPRALLSLAVFTGNDLTHQAVCRLLRLPRIAPARRRPAPRVTR